jgi:hypothetical protein
MGLKEADHIAWAISRARESEAERIAELCGVPLGKVRSWRKGSLSLAPWVIAEIATVLKLDDTVLKQHHQRRRRRQDDDVKSQREMDTAA